MYIVIHKYNRDPQERLGPTDTANEVNEVSLRQLLGAVLMVKPGRHTKLGSVSCPLKESDLHGNILDMNGYSMIDTLID